MASSSQSQTFRSLGESWASWSPEDADQLTCIDSDDEIYSEMDFPSSNPSTGPDNSSQLQPSHFLQDASIVSSPGPELIMPSIHEEYSPDGSSFVRHPSTQAANPPGPGIRLTQVPAKSPHNNVTRSIQALPSRRPSSNITDRLGSREYSRKPLLAGILLLCALYLVTTLLSPSMTESPSATKSGPETSYRSKLPHRYQLILDSRARLGQLLHPSNEAASLLPVLLKESESEVVELCGLLADDMGSKLELEFECNNALVVIRQARELIESLFWHGSVALDDIDRELARIKRLLVHSPKNELDSLSDRFMATLNLHFFKRPIPRQPISEAWWREAEATFALAVSKQLKQIAYVRELLSLFHTRLQPIGKIVSNPRSEEEATLCGSHSPSGEKVPSLASFLKNVRCAVEGSLALLLPFSPKRRRPANDINGVVKRNIWSKLRHADEKQRTAAIVASTLVSQLRDLQGD
ncbi:uncharacterized protein BDCG_04787 [Blastomyces dermatitidis ER-3]|uniref:Uncharacterized protein n=1 Tax=Ajellomyces dermatitidis (strain ER-3 / ATCC MYA-2586) TaxID=559297 RepID=A0ABP2EZC5_AJEDR|nr:uncharacterized protein BDCG_04787 [Blastomyces dermatitidis ER-3]EEQ89667.1 hypothetical protein BDCG_04787 [Blastomyces dermatitidis ER-3]